MSELLFIRHAQAQAGPIRHWQGWSDPPLTPAGRWQAQAIAQRLSAEMGDIAALYTSPLRRATETAQEIGDALGIRPVPVDQLKEIHFGHLEGVTLQEMELRFPILYAQWEDKADMTFRWPGGEQRLDFFNRAAEALSGILARHPLDRVVIVAHGGTIRACLAHVLPHRLGQWWTYSLDNVGLTRVRVGASGAHLLVLNDVRHLTAAEEP